MKNILIILCSGIILTPFLLISMVCKSFRINVWKRLNNHTQTYPTLPDNKIDQLFSLCVNYLITVANYLNMSYNEINIWIFCVIWPVITLVLFVLALL